MTRNGFTLVEMLVSLLIFGMISAAGVAVLTMSVRAQEMADERNGDAAMLRRLGALLAADLGQAAPRLHRDAQGRARAAFTGAPQAMSLVRRGWDNPAGTARASLQRVEYRLAEARLERIAYPMVDGAAPLAPAVMAEGIRRIRLRYRSRNGEWRDRWDTARASELPVAVELVLDIEGMGMLRQLFLAGAGGGR